MGDEVKFIITVGVAVVLLFLMMFITVSIENYLDYKTTNEALKLGYTQVYANNRYVWQPANREVK